MADIHVSNSHLNAIGSDDEDDAICAFIILAGDRSIYTREPIRDSFLTGPERVREILYGHVDRCFEQFKMERHVFFNLEDLMRERGWLQDSRYVRVDEQLALFLSIVGHNDRFRHVAEHFQRSPQTIGKFFRKVLMAFVQLGGENIKPPPFDRIAPEVENNPRLFPYFKDCIGAIDGTHISASVPIGEQTAYRGRKGITTQNVMCACSHDMKFTFVYCGWEGSANDCRVLADARSNVELGFPHPPPGKYYAVDSGYASQVGYLTPFKGERYHLQEYRARGGQPRTAKELFNHRHSSLRNVIERSFGALKRRFPILNLMPCFPLPVQSLIIIACCAIHNYILEEDQHDAAFALYGQSNYVEQRVGVTQPRNVSNDGASSSNQNTRGRGAREMDVLRKTIANQLARDCGLDEL